MHEDIKLITYRGRERAGDASTRLATHENGRVGKETFHVE